MGEALASGAGVLDACAAVGRDLARDGASLHEVLEGLRETTRGVTGQDPPYDVVSAVVNAWGETTLGYLNQLSCDDPLTGLSSQAHLRSRLSELHRVGGDVLPGHVLVVCAPPLGDPSDEPVDHFTRAMRLARTGEMARTVFARDETVARLGSHRVAVLARRDDRLERRVRLLGTLVGAAPGTGAAVRTWVEGIPATDETTGLLLDRLARG